MKTKINLLILCVCMAFGAMAQTDSVEDKGSIPLHLLRTKSGDGTKGMLGQMIGISDYGDGDSLFNLIPLFFVNDSTLIIGNCPNCDTILTNANLSNYTSSADSSVFATLHRLDTAKANLRTEIGAVDPNMGGDLSGTASNSQIVADAVGNTELSNMAANTIKGRRVSSGDPEDLTVDQALGLLGAGVLDSFDIVEDSIWIFYNREGIEVHRDTTNLGGGGGSSSSPYQYYVKDYGTTYDDATVQAAIDAAIAGGGQVLTFENGANYNIRNLDIIGWVATVVDSAKIFINLNGASLTMDTQTVQQGNIYIRNGYKLTVMNGTVIGKYAPGKLSGYTYDERHSFIFDTLSAHTTFINVDFVNIYSHAVRIGTNQPTNDVEKDGHRFFNCTFTNQHEDATTSEIRQSAIKVHKSGGEYMQLANNRFEEVKSCIRSIGGANDLWSNTQIMECGFNVARDAAVRDSFGQIYYQFQGNSVKFQGDGWKGNHTGKNLFVFHNDPAKKQNGVILQNLNGLVTESPMFIGSNLDIFHLDNLHLRPSGSGNFPSIELTDCNYGVLSNINSYQGVSPLQLINSDSIKLDNFDLHDKKNITSAADIVYTTGSSNSSVIFNNNFPIYENETLADLDTFLAEGSPYMTEDDNVLHIKKSSLKVKSINKATTVFDAGTKIYGLADAANEYMMNFSASGGNLAPFRYDDIEIEFRFQINSDSGAVNQKIFSMSGPNRMGLELRRDNNFRLSVFDGATTNDEDDGGIWQDGNYHVVKIKVENDTFRTYNNGVKINELINPNVQLSSNTNNIIIGGSGINSSNGWDGTIDYIKVTVNNTVYWYEFGKEDPDITGFGPTYITTGIRDSSDYKLNRVISDEITPEENNGRIDYKISSIRDITANYIPRKSTGKHFENSSLTDANGDAVATGDFGIGLDAGDNPEVALHVETSGAYQLLRSTNGTLSTRLNFENSGDGNDSWQFRRNANGTFSMGYSSAQPYSTESVVVVMSAEEFRTYTNSILIENVSAATASGLSVNNGRIVYVNSTDATFTSVGFWGVVNGTWEKLD